MTEQTPTIMTYFADERGGALRPLSAYGLQDIKQLAQVASANCKKCHGIGYTGIFSTPTAQDLKAVVLCPCIFKVKEKETVSDIVLKDADDTIAAADKVLEALKRDINAINALDGSNDKRVDESAPSASGEPESK